MAVSSAAGVGAAVGTPQCCAEIDEGAGMLQPSLATSPARCDGLGQPVDDLVPAGDEGGCPQGDPDTAGGSPPPGSSQVVVGQPAGLPVVPYRIGGEGGPRPPPQGVRVRPSPRLVTPTELEQVVESLARSALGETHPRAASSALVGIPGGMSTRKMLSSSGRLGRADCPGFDASDEDGEREVPCRAGCPGQ